MSYDDVAKVDSVASRIGSLYTRSGINPQIWWSSGLRSGLLASHRSKLMTTH